MNLSIRMKGAPVLKLRFVPGLKGDKGDTGDTGADATITLGTVTTGGPGTDVIITNTGTPGDAEFNFTIPRGNTGATGTAATIAAGTTTTLSPGADATVTNAGTSSAAVFNFGIPRGDTGAGVQIGGTTGQVLVKDSNADFDTSWQTVAPLTDGDKGDITVSSSGAAFTIDANVVSDTKLRDSAALSVIGRSANSTGDPADIAAGTDGFVLRRSGTTLGFGTVATAGLTDNAVTDAKLRQGASMTVIGRSTNSTGNVADIQAATDGHVLRRSSTTLGFGTVATAGIADDAVTNAKLANMAQNTIKGRVTASTGDPEDLTATDARNVISALARSTSATPLGTTSGTAQEWTGLPAGITSAVIFFRGISTNGTSTIGVRIGPSGGVVSTGYVGATTMIINATSPATGSVSSILPIILTPAASTIDYGSLRLTLIDATDNLWDATGVFGTSTGVQLITSGAVALSGPLARIQITTVGGTDTFDLGTAYLIYTAP